MALESLPAAPVASKSGAANPGSSSTGFSSGPATPGSSATGPAAGSSASGPPSAPARGVATHGGSAVSGRSASEKAASGSAKNSAASEFLQALTQSLVEADANAASATPEPAPSKAGSDSQRDSRPDADTVDIALALLSQALAGITPPNPQTAASTTAASDAGSNDSTSGATLGIARGNSSAVQQLASLLAQEAADDSTSATGAGVNGTAAAVAPDVKPGGDSGNSAAPTASIQLGASSHLGTQHTVAESSAPTELRSTVGTPAWNDELGGRLTWMANQGLESASLRLSPDHLGPLEVQISVRDGAATVWFGAAQADTRAAIEQALPRLRELFATQGLTLADAGVSREPPRGQQQNFRGSAVTSISSVGENETPITSAVSMRLGLVDTYA